MLTLNLNEPGGGVCVVCMHVWKCSQRHLCVWENLEEGWDISGSDLEQKLGGEKCSEVAGVYRVCVCECEIEVGCMRNCVDSGEPPPGTEHADGRASCAC